MKTRTIDSPYGEVTIGSESPQLLTVQSASSRAAYFGQGAAAATERLWQLELTRRIATGTTAELFGPRAIKTDRFQRNLGLARLAARDLDSDRQTVQYKDVCAYVEGINWALARTRVLPVELALLRHRPDPFRPLDVYLVGQLKHFINSTWKFEVLHTLVRGALAPDRAAALFSTFTAEGSERAALPEGQSGLAQDAAAVLADGLDGLERLGLSSPDIGSNAFAVSGSRTASGAPLLASDPHMGVVNPGFNLLFRMHTDDGLDVIGSHFPGSPGIVIGRNRDIAWGMVGLMADNQDLGWAPIDETGERVEIGGTWIDLEVGDEPIRVRGAVDVPHRARGFSRGRLIHEANGVGLFLRWTALEAPVGTMTLADLNRARDWDSFCAGLRQLNNAPMVSVYADRHGHIGLHAVGLIPRRKSPLGSLVSRLGSEDPWLGVLDFDELPSVFDPPSGVVHYANQYAESLFDSCPPIANRWHPPSRAHRIEALLGESNAHTTSSFNAIQDDMVDVFAQAHIEWLTGQLSGPNPFGNWQGDTREREPALLFEGWIDAITRAVLAAAWQGDPPADPAALIRHYRDQWPMHRWNILAILRHKSREWGLDVPTLVRDALACAQAAPLSDRVEVRHTLRGSRVGRHLFAASHQCDGGSRETIHVARRPSDFLSSSQSANAAAKNPITFGPSFKVTFDLGEPGTTSYLANMNSSGTSLGPALRSVLARWRRLERYETTIKRPVPMAERRATRVEGLASFCRSTFAAALSWRPRH